MNELPSDASEDSQYPPRPYSWYVVVLLMLFYVLSFLDRQIIAVLIEPIKTDLSLSDVQISLLGGISFVIFYSTAGVFVGRLADSVSRPALIGFGVFLWSATTACCGLASKFWHLLFFRMGVGLGESALLPSSLSLIADYFPRRQLATPTSVFMLGAPIGIGLAFAGGGYLYGIARDLVVSPGWQQLPIVGDLAPWKLVLVAIGAIGMLMALLMFSVREPRKKTSRKQGSQHAATLDQVKKYFFQHWQAIGGLYVGMSFISLASYSQGFWDITFLSRTYGWDPVAGSVWYGGVQLVGGVVGMLAGGYFADRLTSKGIKGSSVVMVLVGAGMAFPFSIAYPLMPTANVSLMVMFFAILGNSMAFACTASAIQKLFPSRMLGLAAGIYFFVSNAVGIGIGPTAVAAITDYVLDDTQLIRYSLASVGSVSRASAFLLVFLSFNHYRKLSVAMEEKNV